MVIIIIIMVIIVGMPVMMTFIGTPTITIIKMPPDGVDYLGGLPCYGKRGALTGAIVGILQEATSEEVLATEIVIKLQLEFGLDQWQRFLYDGIPVRSS